jgi:hypothetical protein
MQPIDFYALPRAAQERFVGSVNGSGLPVPILRTLTRPKEPFAWAFASAVSLVLVLVLARSGYGDLGSSVAVQGVVWLVLYVALLALVIFGALRALAIVHEHGRSPFPRGIYVFPVGLIDARSAELLLYPVEDLANVKGPDAKGITLDFGGKSFAFAVTDDELTATASREIASARGVLDEARGSRESIRPKALAAVDPLQGFTNPLGASERMVSRRPPWASFAWAIAAALGVVIGGSVWIVRNATSDDAMFDRATTANDSASLSAYLEKGTRHKAEVATTLLPRAELRDAQKAGTVEAIEQFVANHPQTSIASEVTTVLKAALLLELDAAVKVGTLAAIEDFARRHPDASVQAEVLRARHGVYKAALDRYLAEAPPKAPAETAFVQALVAWVEAKGPQVEIRFHRERSKTLDKADTAVAKHSMFRGVISLPSHYFDGEGEKTYEDALVMVVAQRFARVFPADILTLATGEPIVAADTPLPAKIAVPTLFIEHGASWHGAVATSKDPRGVFCGLQLSFDALFRLPDATKPVRVTFDAWRIPNIAAASGADKPEEAIYSEMHAKAFDLFEKRLLGAFFEPGK